MQRDLSSRKRDDTGEAVQCEIRDWGCAESRGHKLGGNREFEMRRKGDSGEEMKWDKKSRRGRTDSEEVHR